MPFKMFFILITETDIPSISKNDKPDPIWGKNKELQYTCNY